MRRVLEAGIRQFIFNNAQGCGLQLGELAVAENVADHSLAISLQVNGQIRRTALFPQDGDESMRKAMLADLLPEVREIKEFS